ncbi:sex peptide receptor-like [Ruditapes philippinarum]|uniref:sex peptide receptor-like n=1 Tax=Ruditapes philippinarum TaxID=129788 RepID=UPI00295C3305|nr:sex peptide receptor-like [Ruditapes philippinarum]
MDNTTMAYDEYSTANSFDNTIITYSVDNVSGGNDTGYNTTVDDYSFNDDEGDNITGNGTDVYDLYYPDDEYYFEIYEFERYTLGHVQLILTILTALTNFFVAIYFLTNKNRGKATNLLFVSIAFSDTMTGVALLPNSIGVYIAQNEFFTRDMCNAYMISRFYISPLFHTVSVWQTVVLCIQRYMCVCHPFISGRICTFWKTFTSIVVMYCGAIVMHSYHLVDNKIGHNRCRWQTETPCKESCMYLWFCVALQHLLPCFLLVWLTIVTILELRTAQERVSTMSHRRSVSRSSRDKIITYTAALIVLFFLIPELPHGIYRLVFVINKHMGEYEAINPRENHIIICIYELALNVSFSANFWIYCFMMRDFRYEVFKILSCGAFKRSLARLRSISWSSRGGSVQTSLSRTSSIASRNRVFSRTTSVHSTTSENVHAVIPLTPTRGYDQINYNDTAGGRGRDDAMNDDVFM